MSSNQSSMSRASESAVSRASAHALSYASSSSGGMLFSDVSMNIDVDGFVWSSQRAGGPYLCSLPAYQQRATEADYIHSLRHEHVGDNVGRILERNRINYAEMQIIGRVSRVDPEPTPVPTVLVLVDGCSSSHIWRRAAREIHHYISTVCNGFSVEIIDMELDIPPKCFPIRPTDSIFAKWDSIRTRILREFNYFDWTALECWRFGRSPDATQNPPTIIVSIRKESLRQHHTDCQRVKGILAQCGEFDVAVLFMKDEVVFHAADRTLPADACTSKILPGVSIGIRHTSTGSSTLGGFVEVLMPGERTWQKFALTCFHAVFPPNGDITHLGGLPGTKEVLERWQWKPVAFQDPMARRLLKVNQPSSEDIHTYIDDLQHKIHMYKSEKFINLKQRLQEEASGSEDVFITDKERASYGQTLSRIGILEQPLKHAKNFLDSGYNYLGKVIAGSGLGRVGIQVYDSEESQHPCALDWALVKPRRAREEEGSDNNKPFGYGSWLNGFNIIPNIKFRAPDQPDPRLTDQLFKSGRTSQITVGEYGKVLQTHLTREMTGHGEIRVKITYEHAMATSRNGNPFSNKGDSGALIFDNDGGVIGLLFGGCPRKHTSYFTPIESVFADIKKVTGAIDVRIAE